MNTISIHCFMAWVCLRRDRYNQHDAAGHLLLCMVYVSVISLSLRLSYLSAGRCKAAGLHLPKYLAWATWVLGLVSLSLAAGTWCRTSQLQCYKRTALPRFASALISSAVKVDIVMPLHLWLNCRLQARKALKPLMSQDTVVVDAASDTACPSSRA